MSHDVDCEGKVRLGSLPRDVGQRLCCLDGDWLEFAPEESAVVVRHVQPGGCPALAAVPCELISLIDAIPPEQRENIPGGTLYVKDRSGQILRVLVERGEVRIQWPREDYSHPTPVSPEAAMRAVNPREARLNGWLRFGGTEASLLRLRDFADRFEGLYPEGDLLACREGGIVVVKLVNVNVGPEELLAELRALADPADSLQAEIDVSSFAAGSMDRDFRLLIGAGQVRALLPSLWGESR